MAKRAEKSLLRHALGKSPLATHVKAGVGALIKADVALIAQAERPNVGDSLDLDGATRSEYPSANRWDYILSVPAKSRLVALEPHSARDSEVSVIIAKRRNSLDHLRSHLGHHRVADWYWVSSGKVSFSSMEGARRRLDQHGITFVGRVLKSLG